MVTKYGILGDVHNNIENYELVLGRTLKEGVDALVLNGDIGNSPLIMLHVLNKAGKSGKKVYVQPGSHENVIPYRLAIENTSSRHDITDVVMGDRVIKCKDHTLAFIPGSQSFAGGQYVQEEADLEQGLYFNLGKGQLMPIEENDLEKIRRYEDADKNIIYISKPSTIEDKIKNPENTIVFNHNPSRFELDEKDKEIFKDGVTLSKIKKNNLGVDTAHYLNICKVIKDEEGNLGYRATAVAPALQKRFLKQAGAKVIEYQEHLDDPKAILESTTDMKEGDEFFVEEIGPSGNEDLNTLYERLNLKKVISSHIHEASHKAHDSKRKPIKQHKYTSELFYNPGANEYGLAAILTVEGNKIKHKNITLPRRND